MGQTDPRAIPSENFQHRGLDCVDRNSAQAIVVAERAAVCRARCASEVAAEYPVPLPERGCSPRITGPEEGYHPCSEECRDVHRPRIVPHQRLDLAGHTDQACDVEIVTHHREMALCRFLDILGQGFLTWPDHHHWTEAAPPQASGEAAEAIQGPALRLRASGGRRQAHHAISLLQTSTFERPLALAVEGGWAERTPGAVDSRQTQRT